MIPLQHGLILAAILFVLGLTGLVIRRNLLFMLAISLAAAEASIGLALLLQLHRRRQNLNIDSVSELRG